MFNFSLYHGTSSYFLQEILEHGLGGLKISKEWGIEEFFAEVIFECSLIDDLQFQKYFQNNQQMLDRILGKFHNSKGFNYRYGSVYLAVDHKRAIQYSLRKFGSELTRISHGWYLELKTFKPEIALKLIAKYPKVSEIFSAVHTPLVIEIKEINFHEIATEGGLLGEDLKIEINKFLDVKENFGADLDGSISGPSFEYIGSPLMRDRLNFYHVEPTTKAKTFDAFSTKLSLFEIK
jgi:hypothetical protein